MKWTIVGSREWGGNLVGSIAGWQSNPWQTFPVAYVQNRPPYSLKYCSIDIGKFFLRYKQVSYSANTFLEGNLCNKYISACFLLL